MAQNRQPAARSELPTQLDTLRIIGARTHNLRDVSLEIPHNQLTVITGVSGSGKSSLAFDTIYAEGQRQYIESLSTYARQFLNQLERPDVDSIEGLQPTLCIDQRAGIANPRSTVATVAEVYDYLRLLMARVGTAHCYECGSPIVQQSPDEIQNWLANLPEGSKLVLLAPVVRGRRGAHRDALQSIQKAGLLRVRVDGELYDIESVPELAVRKNHTIEAVVDKIIVRPSNRDRLSESIWTAIRLADGLVSASYLTPDAEHANEANLWIEQMFSTKYACANCGISYEEVEPRTFSFNSPYGACPTCDGVGQVASLDFQAIAPNPAKSANAGGLAFLKAAPTPLASKIRKHLKALFEAAGNSWELPLSAIEPDNWNLLLHKGASQISSLNAFVNDLRSQQTSADWAWLDPFQTTVACPTCKGSRLRREALSIKLADRNIAEICRMTLSDVAPWFEQLKLSTDKSVVAKPILSEMMHRLRYLVQVGVDYLSLDRSADTLSGGELQRVRLASCIGSGLVGVCYILDEPSIGLHQRDNDRLIQSLRDLQQQGNTVIVVEHDEAMMLAADCLIDIGPGAGSRGGHIVAMGAPSEVAQAPNSITSQYLRGEKVVADERSVRSPVQDQFLRLSGASLHNLQNVSVDIPIGLLVGITGVSGSGKSSLISDTLVPAILQRLDQRSSARPGPFASLQGVELVDKLIELTQAPIGRTPRSTPATYCGVFDMIRAVWATTREAKTRGFTISRFSFNAGPGRCSTCQGQGQEKIEMNFLPDLYVTCSECGGKRYNRQTLQVKYREKSISDVLEMSIDEAADFFSNFEKIHRLLNTLQQVGLGYLSLGQSSNTLSGGEAQRIKLATELARPETGRTIYFLDEPTTGLHFDDVRRLILVLNGLVDRGNTVIVIEHNLDVIRACDWLIDLGPDGGAGGGQVLGSGTPATIASQKDCVTGRYLATTARPQF